jgi:hypothetical protein
MAIEKTVKFKQINLYKQRSVFMQDLFGDLWDGDLRAYLHRLSLTLWGIII